MPAHLVPQALAFFLPRAPEVAQLALAPAVLMLVVGSAAPSAVSLVVAAPEWWLHGSSYPVQLY